MKNYQQVKTKLLSDQETKKAYDDLGGEYKLVEALIKKRLELNLTQKELAQKIGTKQSAISRLESGHYNPSLKFLHKVARGLESQLQILLF